MRLVIASMGLLAASVAASGLVSWQGQPSVELKNGEPMAPGALFLGARSGVILYA